MSNEGRYVCYMFINKRLKMGSGKIAAQVAHGMDYLTDDISSQNQHTKDCWRRWKETNRRIIVLKCENEEEMEEIHSRYPSIRVIDMGLTQVNPNSFTVLALFPGEFSDNEFSQKLL